MAAKFTSASQKEKKIYNVEDPKNPKVLPTLPLP